MLILSDFLLSELSAAKIPFLIVVVARYFISVKVTPDTRLLSYRLGPYLGLATLKYNDKMGDSSPLSIDKKKL